MVTTPGRVAAASTPPGAGRAEQGNGPMFRTPPAQGAERRPQDRYMEFSPMYGTRLDRGSNLGTKLAPFDRKVTAHLRSLSERAEEHIIFHFVIFFPCMILILNDIYRIRINVVFSSM